MKRLFLFLFLIIFSHSSVFSQNRKRLDSLLLELRESKKDTFKTHTLIGLWKEYIDNDVDSAVYYANEIIKLAKYLDNESTLSSGYQRLGIANAYMSNYKESIKYYKKALKIYQKHNAYSPSAAMQLNIGMDFRELGIIDSALYYNDEAAKNFGFAKDYEGVATTHDVKSGIYLDKGYFQLSLKESFTAAKIYKSKQDEFNLQLTNCVIALNYLNLKDTILAEQYFKKSLDYFTKNHNLRRQSDIMVDLASLCIPRGDLETSKTLLDSALIIAKKLNSPNKESSVYLRMANYYEKINNLNKAILFNEKSLKLSDSLKLPVSSAIKSINLSRLYLINNEYGKSLTQAIKGLELSKTHKLIKEQKTAYSILSDLELKKNNYKKSLEYYKKYKILNDSIYNSESTNQFAELKIIYETEKKEAQIALQNEAIKTLNIKAQNDNLTKTLYGTGMISFIVIAGLLFFGFKQRIKKNQIEREKQEAIYKQEIAFKKKELASQTLHLVQKNTFIQELKENLEKIKQSPELFKIEFRRLVMLLKKESAEDKDWEVFKSYFSEVHNNFDNKLKTVYADITEKEIRLASFLRMNLSTKEIASMLNVLPESVLKSKYRLKKKLNLDKETDLNVFLNSL